MKNRDFTRYGVKFHLNDFKRNEFDAKYTLLYFHPVWHSWYELCKVDTKKEALAVITECRQRKTKMFAYI